jgi:hypothetical protein
MTTKRTILKLWVWGAAVMAAGGIVILASSLALVAHVSNVTADGTTFEPDNFFWTTVFFIALGSIVAGGGLIAQLVAHKAAEANTRHLADDTWFRRLRRRGIVSTCIALATLAVLFVGGAAQWRGTGVVVWIGFPVAVLIEWSAMIPYLLGGPDGTAETAVPATPAATIEGSQAGPAASRQQAVSTTRRPATSGASR